MLVVGCGASAGNGDPSAEQTSTPHTISSADASSDAAADGGVRDPISDARSGSDASPAVDDTAPKTSDAAPAPAPADDTGTIATDSGSGAAPLDSGAPVDDAGSPDVAPPTPPPPPSSATGASILAAEAKRELTAMVSSTYTHTTFVDESTGTFDYDCSGFVGYALGYALPDAWSTLLGSTGVSRPLAKDFETFFASLDTVTPTGRWLRVVRVDALVPGDVVAWLEPAVLTGNTGHVMIVREIPTVNPARSDEMLVPVTDATSTPHGPADSRTATGSTGLGTGTIGLFPDASGAPAQYRWTGGYSTSIYTTEIALGHVQ